jgi:hypothetical protein
MNFSAECIQAAIGYVEAVRDGVNLPAGGLYGLAATVKANKRIWNAHAVAYAVGLSDEELAVLVVTVHPWGQEWAKRYIARLPQLPDCEWRQMDEAPAADD